MSDPFGRWLESLRGKKADKWKARAEAAEAERDRARDYLIELQFAHARLEKAIRDHLKYCTEDTWKAMEAALSDTAQQEAGPESFDYKAGKTCGLDEMRERAANWCKDERRRIESKASKEGWGGEIDTGYLSALEDAETAIRALPLNSDQEG